MATSPGTVSKILWHFTGGPKWNNKLKKQDKRRKSTARAYEALTGILRSKTLRLGGYQEVVEIIVPEIIEWNKKSSDLKIHKNVKKQISSASVCCLADIPIIHLGHHSQRYGKIAIGFHRSAVLKARFSPVFYQLQDSDILLAFYEAFAGLHKDVFTPLEYYVTECSDHIEDVMFEHARKAESLGLEANYLISQEVRTVNEAIKRARSAFRIHAAFMKTFNLNEMDMIYTEREWRSVEPFRFDYSDIAMIVIPRAGGYFERFIAKSEKESLNLPRSIPIVPWEDLIEH